MCGSFLLPPLPRQQCQFTIRKLARFPPGSWSGSQLRSVVETAVENKDARAVPTYRRLPFKEIFMGNIALAMGDTGSVALPCPYWLESGVFGDKWMNALRSCGLTVKINPAGKRTHE